MSAALNSGHRLEYWKRHVVDQLVQKDDPSMLSEYAFHLSKVLAYPDLDVGHSVNLLDSWGRKVLQNIKKSPTSPPRPTFIIEKINEELFQSEGFGPDIEDYYNPLNSYLNIVIERKKGIPITLCIIYLRLAHSVNFAMQPVNFPAHFLIKHVMEGGNGEIIVDPFNGGRIMDDYSLNSLLERSFPRQNISLTKSFVERTTSAQVMIRMLNNLKSSYSEVSDNERFELANDMILAVDQYNPDAIRDRGLMLNKKGRTSEALEVLNTYLEIDPEAVDADDILDLIRRLRRDQK